MFIDTHAHLNLKDFASDVDAVLTRAENANIGKIICVGDDYKTSVRAIELAEKYTSVFATIGLHPECLNDEEFNFDNYAKLAQNKKVVAIGEIGLEYFVGNIDKPAQQKLFKKQIDLALTANKPIAVHSREAYTDLISIFKSLPKVPAGVIHCYVGDWPTAQALLAMGFYLSFTGIITFTKDTSSLTVVSQTSLDRILIETDSPYLAPPPHRGERNEPAYVVEVAKKIAEIKNLPLAAVEAQTTKNANELFNLDL